MFGILLSILYDGVYVGLMTSIYRSPVYKRRYG